MSFNPSDESPLTDAEAAPNGFLKKALSVGASTMLGASKKVADLIISRSRPALLIDGLLKPEAIIELLHHRDNYPNLRKEQLVLAATNTVQTLPHAFALLQELRQTRTRKPHGDWSILDYCEWVFHAASAAVAGDVSSVYVAVANLERSGIRFRHPVISRFLFELARRQQTATVTQYAEDVLFYFPLDQDALAAVLEVVPDLDLRRTVLEQLWALSNRGVR